MKKIRTQASVVFCFAIAIAAMAAGTDGAMSTRDFAVRIWGRAEGLPGDSVTAILQTRDGYLWVGTTTRLVRFDGVKFTEIWLPIADPNTPARITALCEDSTGKLWVGTQQDGLICLDADGIKNYRKGRGLLDNNVASLAADAEGQLWIGTAAGLNRWDGHQFTAFTSRDGLTDESVIGVHVARSGVVWITTRSGMYQFKDGHILPYEFQTESQGRRPEFLGAYEDRQGNLWVFGDTYLINLAEGKRFNYFRGSDAASVRIWSLCEGRDGRLWIGTSGRGLFCFGDNKFQPVTLNELHWPNDVRAICEDREGNLWLGTSGGGLVELLPRPVEVLKADQGLPAGPASCLTMDLSGRIYVGFESAGLFAGEAGQFERFGTGADWEGQSLITSMCVGRDGSLWIATSGNGVYSVRNGRQMQFTTLNGLADNSVLAVCGTPDGAIWIGTRAGTLHRLYQDAMTSFSRKDGLPGSAITALLPARAGGLFLGTENGLVLRGESGRFTVIHRAASPILTLYQDEKNRLWMGTATSGLVCWTGQSFQAWNLQNGLPDDYVYGVLEDLDGDFWLTTASGISLVARNTVQDALVNSTPLRCKLKFETRTAPEPSGNFGWPRALRSPEGKLWFATSEGLMAVDKSGDAAVAPPPPPVYIETILVNGKLLPNPVLVPSVSSNQTPRVRLPGLQSLEFKFTALSFVAPEKLQFRHKLEGSDQEWVADGTERRVRYGPLPYGNYRFRVAASLPDGIWTEAVTPFDFTVPTPLWRTPGAIMLYSFLIVCAVAGVVRLVFHRRLRLRLSRLEQQQALERERMRIAQDMHDDIGSKLTKLSFLSERVKMESDNGRPVGSQIASIATTSRELLQTLDEIVWAVNPRNDSLEHLAAYLSHYAVEYFQNTTVHCEMRLPRHIPHHPLSAELRHNLFLAFEEALNNTLKHSGATRVSVEMTANRNDFEIVIADNGHGFNVATEKAERLADSGRRGGNGLVNMRERLASVGGECVVRSESGCGTTIRLRIALNGATKIKL